MIKSLWVFAALSIVAATATAQPDRTYAQANAAISTSPEAVFMGNSITAHWVEADSTFFVEHNFVGRGIGGQITSQMLSRFRSDVVALHPKVVVIMGGVNDIGYRLPLEFILGNLASMCDIARSNGIRPVLCSVMPAYRFPTLPEIDLASQIVALDSLIRAYAMEQRIPYVDYYPLMTDSRGGLRQEYALDAVHPNQAGYKVMEQELMKTLSRELRRAPKPRSTKRPATDRANGACVANFNY